MKKNKVSLKKRFEHSVEEAKRGGGGGSVFDWSKYKGEVKFYKTNKYGRHKVIILPYWIKTKNHPLVRTGDFAVGDPDYLFEYWAHKGMGPAHDKKVLCINKMYGKPCPICEQRQKFMDKGKTQEANTLRPQQSAIYNIYDANDIEAGIQVLDVSYSNFQKKMVREASDYKDGEPVIIGEPDDLKVVKFKSYEDNYLAAKFPNYESFSFEDCEDKIDPGIIDETISFDELLKVLTTEEISKMMFGDDEDSDDNNNEEDDDENNEEEEEKPKTKKQTKVEEDEDEDEESEEEEPEEEEEEEVKSAPTKSSKKSTNEMTCPHKHKFGSDCNKYPKHCDECDVWNECLKEQNRLKKASK